MVKFANAISRITCRDLVTNTPTEAGVRALLNATVSINKTKMGGVPQVAQEIAMVRMGARSKDMATVDKFIKSAMSKPTNNQGINSKLFHILHNANK